ncbi:helix-turn-helix transcriptional regulator [Maribellus sp. CM-23]|nr:MULTISPECIES: XRE family transcriptional regulator [Maribellus]MCE4565121.1 helix-turn-helix transcriptional regulator [Maribellus sp. CM-23]
MKRIGERIKRKREQFNFQLNELAEKVGISPSALSQIEKAKSFPSIITLKAIAENLHTTVGELIGENDSLANNPVVHKADIKFIEQNKSGAMFYLLSQHDTSKQMDTYLVRFSKASAIDGFFANAFGQIFSYVLSGEVRFDLDGKSFILKPGDNIYFNAKSQFNAINHFDGISEILWIQSPPHF